LVKKAFSGARTEIWCQILVATLIPGSARCSSRKPKWGWLHCFCRAQGTCNSVPRWAVSPDMPTAASLCSVL
jgi:hypothetical protein